MTENERQLVSDVLNMCVDARHHLGSSSSFRSRTMLDMTILELKKDLARVPAASPAKASKIR